MFSDVSRFGMGNFFNLGARSRSASAGGAFRPKSRTGYAIAGFTLAEVVMAIALIAMTVTALVTGYIQVFRQAEWNSYSLAAQDLAQTRIEEARACPWRSWISPPEDMLVQSNFPERVEILHVPRSGAKTIWATNRVVISTVSSNPPLRMIYTECIWTFLDRGLFTNRIITYRAPDP